MTADSVDDSAAFSVSLNSPTPYEPIGEGLISLSASLSGQFELANVQAEASVEGLSDVFSLTSPDGSSTLKGKQISGGFMRETRFSLL